MEIDQILLEILEIDQAMNTLKSAREELRSEMIKIMTEQGFDTYANEKGSVAVSHQQRVSSVDIERIKTDYDLSDCYEISLAKVKKRPDIPIQMYTTYKTVDSLRVSPVKDKPMTND